MGHSESKFAKKAFAAVKAGNEKQLAETLQNRHNQNINVQDANGLTLLRIAQESQQPYSLCKCLVHHGANTNIPDSNGVTPLYKATLQNEEDLIQLFVNSGADINDKQNLLGRTPLIEATIRGNEKIIEFLIVNGADVNLSDKLGRTPLHWAAHNGNENLVQYYLEHKSDICLRDNTHSTPLLLAKQKEYINIVRSLEQRFCTINKLDMTGISPVSSCACSVSGSDDEKSKKSKKSKKGKEKQDDKRNVNEKSLKFSGKTEKNSNKKSSRKSKRKEQKKNLEADKSKIQRKISLLSDSQLRVVCRTCFDKPADTLLLPCGDIASCLLCSQYLQKCPVCKSSISAASRVYLS
eukprot:TRINITY_DN3146_c0_g1_i1.p1 TRINITY_DN3146_c0_g1~~TRINITY_DN3146_c0_g1_i1.p1  ORF type:complete len:351 (+),score=42.62 TRINITY_DN3146_c0_g1_i1:103-1155(+)